MRTLSERAEAVAGTDPPRRVGGCAVISSVFTSGLCLPGRSSRQSVRAPSQIAGGAVAGKRAGRRGLRRFRPSRRTGERVGSTDRRGRRP